MAIEWCGEYWWLESSCVDTGEPLVVGFSVERQETNSVLLLSILSMSNYAYLEPYHLRNKSRRRKFTKGIPISE